MADELDVLRKQQAYYDARAPEYDDWWYRRGRYDRGPQANADWLRDVATVEQALASFAPLGDVVELAAGTGIWTRWLAPLATSVTAVDGSAEMLEHHRRRVGDDNVGRIQADLFDWQPPRSFDEVFMGFWLSHVPPDLFDSFWRLVEQLVGGAGRFFFVDSLYTEASTATDHQLRGSDATSVTRRLDDGREFEIVKVFHDRGDLQRRLENLGWRVTVKTTGEYFLYGYGER